METCFLPNTVDNVKLNFQDSEIDLLVYKGTGSGGGKAVSEIIEIDSSSKETFGQG